MKSIHVSARVKRKLTTLQRTGKPGQALAQKVERIIFDLKSGGGIRPKDTSCAMTKYGEKRIRRCRKFDLGLGYRLIILYRNQEIYLPFLGTHDQCRRWLENNSRLKEVAPGNWTSARIRPSDQEDAHTSGPNTEPDPEEELMRRLSDQDLRYVFRGLVAGAKTG